MNFRNQLIKIGTHVSSDLQFQISTSTLRNSNYWRGSAHPYIHGYGRYGSKYVKYDDPCRIMSHTKRIKRCKVLRFKINTRDGTTKSNWIDLSIRQSVFSNSSCHTFWVYRPSVKHIDIWLCHPKLVIYPYPVYIQPISHLYVCMYIYIYVYVL